MYISIQLYLCLHQTVEAAIVEVPGNADFTKGKFWPACPCVTNVMLTTPTL